jgi:hypothetical protein
LSIHLARGERAERSLGPGEPEGSARAPREAPAAEGSRPLRTAGWIAISVGLAGFVGVGITGGKLLADEGDFAACVESDACDARDLEGDESGWVAANAVAWGVGIAGVGAGLTLVIADAAGAGRGPSVEARVAPRGIVVGGRF